MKGEKRVLTQNNLQKRLIMTTVTEILDLYRYVGDTAAAEVALTELINESYSAGYSFAKNEAGLIEEVTNALAAE